MDSEIVPSSGNMLKCSDYGCSCSLTAEPSGNRLRSVKRKYDEREWNNQFVVPGLDFLSVARVQVENECVLLRETVCSQQKSIQDLYAELEEERNASSSAATEAMSMILRLQREKAEVQMEARQFKRVAEEKMSHDQQGLLALEDLLNKKEQAIQSLTCEVQAYKYRMMSYGLTEFEAEGQDGQNGVEELDSPYEISSYEYPPLRCKANSHAAIDADNDDTDIEKYVFGETPRDRLRNLESRISQMEGSSSYSQLDGDFTAKHILEKVVVGQSPRRSRQSRDLSSFTAMGRDRSPERMTDSPKLNGSFRKMNYFSEDHSNLKKVDNASEAGDDMSDRVYTIDSIHNGVPYNGFTDSYEDFETTPKNPLNHADFEDPDIKKLYMRLQALEADRESMRQAFISMRSDEAQLLLLKEIAQHLCKEMSPPGRITMKKPSVLCTFSFLTIFKWVASIVFWRKKAHKSKYMFGLSASSMGLRILLDKGPRQKPWRCLSSTQMRKQFSNACICL